MKKLIFLFLFSIVSYTSFSQSNDLPAFLVEANVGYAVGINLDSAVKIDIKVMYTFTKFGFALEAGSLLTPDKYSFHVFAGPMMFFINNEKLRVPLAIGFDLFQGKTLYYAIGTCLSLHYRLTKYIYAGINLGITYAFNNVYDEIVGEKENKIVYLEGTFTQLIPIIESRSHYGSYIYIKPSISIGFQF
jgi:hypothetical protein